jgi:hypothetical protein
MHGTLRDSQAANNFRVLSGPFGGQVGRDVYLSYKMLRQWELQLSFRKITEEVFSHSRKLNNAKRGNSLWRLASES